MKMGRAEPRNLYETIPANQVKAASPPPGPRDHVRYVANPSGDALEDNYSFHITYHTPEEPSYATTTRLPRHATLPVQRQTPHSYPTPERGYNHRIQTLPSYPTPERGYSHKIQTLPHTTTTSAAAAAFAPPHLTSGSPVRASSLIGWQRGPVSPDECHIRYDPDEVFGVPLPPCGGKANYTKERLQHFRDEGALGEPTSCLRDDDQADKDGDRKRRGRRCVAPPWWGWVIIALVLGLISAVMYYIFGQLLIEPPKISDSTLVPLTRMVSVTKRTSLLTTSTTVSLQQPATDTTTVLSTSVSTEPPPTYAAINLTELHDDVSKVFILTTDTRSVITKSTPRTLSSSQTLENCWQDCLGRAVPCYGFDFNDQWKTCHLLNTPDYRLEPVGTTHQIHNYRRTFTLRSYCEQATYFHTGRTLAGYVHNRRMPREVDSLPRCRRACLGRYGNGRQEDGYRCTAGTFNHADGTCRITDAQYDPNMLRDTVTSHHFLNDGVQCVKAPTAACMVKFSPVTNRKPVDLEARMQEAVHMRTVPDCATACFNFRNASGATCQGFVFTYRTAECKLYTGERTSALDPATGTDFYGIDPQTCHRCGYQLRPQSVASGGVLQNAKTRRSCKERCDRWTSAHNETCYGYDVTKLVGSDVECHVITDPAPRVTDRKDTDHYTRDPACQGCVATRFLTTIHTSPPGGTTYGLTSLRGCAHACQGSVSPPRARRCHGFTFDRHNATCRLFYRFDHDISNVGLNITSDHYRRLYTCPDEAVLPCNSYNATMDTEAQSAGVQQPWDISTVQLCQDRCWGYGVSTNDTCYGFDFSVPESRCTMYLNRNYTTGNPGNAPGTNHYIRQVTC